MTLHDHQLGALLAEWVCPFPTFSLAPAYAMMPTITSLISTTTLAGPTAALVDGAAMAAAAEGV